MIFNRQLRELPYFQTNPIWKLGEQVSLIFYTVPFGLNQNLKFYAINNWATGLDEYHDILNTPDQKHGNTSGCSPLVAFWMRFGTHWDALGRCIHKTHADIVSQQSWKPKQYHNNCPRKIASKRSGLGITVPNQC